MDWKDRFPKEHIYYEEDNGIVYNADVLEVLRQIPDESIDIVITSPPYFQMRDYKVEGQIGLEPILDCGDSCGECYICKLIAVMKELKRILKKTGSIWWNMGDGYGGLSGKYAGYPDRKTNAEFPNLKGKKRAGNKKCLMLAPERFAIRCVDELNLILRQKIIWTKQIYIVKEGKTIGSVMPTSSNDRFIEAYEYLFFFVKNRKYYSNLDAVKIPAQTLWVKEFRPPGFVRTAEYGYDSKYLYADEFVGGASRLKYRSIEEEKQYRQGMHRLRGFGIVEKRYNLPPQKEFVDEIRKHFTIDEIVKKTGLPRTKVEHWFRYDESGFSYPTKEDWELVIEKTGKRVLLELLDVVYETDAIGKGSIKVEEDYKKQDNVPGRNANIYKGFNERWKQKIEEYKGKFFGMGEEAEKFGSPRARAERINTRTPKEGYEYKTRNPERTVSLMRNIPNVWNINPEPHNFRKELGVDTEHFATMPKKLAEIPIKFACPPDGIVLDPFAGSGTTLVVAKELGKKFIGIDLHAGYCEIAKRRLMLVQNKLF